MEVVVAKPKAYLERATTGELLEEVRRRAIDSFAGGNRPLWSKTLFRHVVDIIGMLPREILDYKPKEQ
jgi:hypothetical protein